MLQNSVKLFKNQFSCVLTMHVTGTTLLYLLICGKFTFSCYPNRKCFENKGLKLYVERFNETDRMVCCHSDHVITSKSIEKWVEDQRRINEKDLDSKCCSDRKFVAIEKCRFHSDLSIKTVFDEVNNLNVTVDKLELIRVQPLNKNLLFGLSDTRQLSLKDVPIQSFDFLESLPSLEAITLNNVKVKHWWELAIHQSLTNIYIFDSNLRIADVRSILTRDQLKLVRIEFRFEVFLVHILNFSFI